MPRPGVPRLRRGGAAPPGPCQCRSARPENHHAAPLGGMAARAVALVGAVRRPGFSALLGAYSLLRNRQEVKEVISRGDDQVLRGAVMLLEERGHRVVGAHELAPDLVAPAPLTGARQPGRRGRPGRHRLGLDLLALPVGVRHRPGRRRGAPACAGDRGAGGHRPDAAAGAAHAASLARPAPPREGGVLIKAAKRGQDLRVDMPAIGPRTVAEAAGRACPASPSARAPPSCSSRTRPSRMADRLGLFLMRVDCPGWSAPHGS